MSTPLGNETSLLRWDGEQSLDWASMGECLQGSSSRNELRLAPPYLAELAPPPHYLAELRTFRAPSFAHTPAAVLHASAGLQCCSHQVQCSWHHELQQPRHLELSTNIRDVSQCLENAPTRAFLLKVSTGAFKIENLLRPCLTGVKQYRPSL